MIASIVVIIYFQLETACIIPFSTHCRSCSSQTLLVLLEALLNRHRLHTCNFYGVRLLFLSCGVDNVGAAALTSLPCLQGASDLIIIQARLRVLHLVLVIAIVLFFLSWRGFDCRSRSCKRLLRLIGNRIPSTNILILCLRFWRRNLVQMSTLVLLGKVWRRCIKAIIQRRFIELRSLEGLRGSLLLLRYRILEGAKIDRITLIDLWLRRACTRLGGFRHR